MTLASFLQKNKRLSEEEIYVIAKQVASALDYAHQKSIGDEPLAHRSLKFNNILINPSKDLLEVKLTDFGLSRVISIGAVLSRTYRILWEMMAIEAGFDHADSLLDRYGEGEGYLMTLHDSFYRIFCLFSSRTKRKESNKP